MCSIMHFFGVQTGGSSSLMLFPMWAEALGLPEDAWLEGVDLPLNAAPEQYRVALQRVKEEPNICGALVTSHKLNLVHAAGDLFDNLTEEAEFCGEVSAIYKREGKLVGHATDPEAAGLALEHFLGAPYWQEHPTAELLVLGAGGAAVALVVYFLTAAPGYPSRITLVDIDPARLHHIRHVAERLPHAAVHFQFVHNSDPLVNDARVEALPPHSLVVNATGMGKDLPGSPLTDDVHFPEHGAVWELNYRGERPFLQQARRQVAQRKLMIEDGWHYFLLGWSLVISQVFDVDITPDRFQQFAALSATAMGRA